MCGPSSSADKRRAMAAVSSISGVGFCSCQAKGIDYRLFRLSFSKSGGRGRSGVMVGDDATFRAGGGGGDILHGSYGADWARPRCHLTSHQHWVWYWEWQLGFSGSGEIELGAIARVKGSGRGPWSGDVGKQLLGKVEAVDDGSRVNLALGLLFFFARIGIIYLQRFLEWSADHHCPNVQRGRIWLGLAALCHGPAPTWAARICLSAMHAR
jgi:hypothetical protein